MVNDSNDIRLVRRVLEGDAAARGELLLKLGPIVRIRVARALDRRAAGGAHDVNDLLQEVMVQLLERPERILGAWDWFGDPPAVVNSAYVCGRHQFSVNTCNGCHSCDTGTQFTHISPTSGIPAALSGFLTGTSVEDTQFPTEQTWTFADLDRRLVDLYQVANSMCFIIPPFRIEMAEIIRERFPDPVFDIGEAIDILNKVEREALERFPADSKLDPNMAVLVSGIAGQDINAAH